MKGSSDDNLQTSKIPLDEQLSSYNDEYSPLGIVPKEFNVPNEYRIKIDNLAKYLDKRLKNVDEKALNESFLQYVKTPEEITNFSNYLISHLTDIKPYEEILLFYFLQTAVCYSVNFVDDEESDLEWIIGYAILLTPIYSEKYFNFTFFDYRIYEEFENLGNTNTSILKMYYEYFCKIRQKNSAEIILNHLLTIAEHYKPYTVE